MHANNSDNTFKVLVKVTVFQGRQSVSWGGRRGVGDEEGDMHGGGVQGGECRGWDGCVCGGGV